MKIALTVGNSLLKNGCYTRSDGRSYGGCNEYIWCKAFSKQLEKKLIEKGNTVSRIICPEKKFTSYKQEKDYKLNLINKGNYDLVIELHLNAATPSAEGTEVLYKSATGKKYAEQVQKQLCKIFRDRGTKQRNDLYILNGTRPPAILLETFFCTNASDYKKAKGHINRNKIAKLVTKGIQNAIQKG